jgi:hypothetical protein
LAFVAALLWAFVGVTLAQQPTITVSTVPDKARRGEAVRVQIKIANFPSAGLNQMQGTLQWQPGGILTPDTTQFCTPQPPFIALGRAAACTVPTAAQATQTRFQIQRDPQSTAAPVTSGTIIEFRFTVASTAAENQQVTFTVPSGAGLLQTLIIVVGNAQLPAAQVTIQSGTFTVGTACTVTPNFTFSPTVTTNVVEQNVSITFTDTTTATPTTCLATNRERRWNWGNGTSESTVTTATTTHTFANTGTFTVRLTTKDTSGIEYTREQSIEVRSICKPTNVSFTSSPARPRANKRVSFSAQGTACSSGAVVNFSWAFGDNTTGTSANVSHVYSFPGNLTVTLTARDSISNGSVIVTRVVSVGGGVVCESLSCARIQIGKIRRSIIEFAQDNVLPFDEVWNKTVQALNRLDKNLVSKLIDLADGMSDGLDQFDELVSGVTDVVEAVRDGVAAAAETGDVSFVRASNINQQLDRFTTYLDETLPDLMDAISEAISELSGHYEDALSALEDADPAGATDALLRARSLVAQARRASESVMSNVLSNLSQISRSVLVAERLARRRQSGGTLPGLGALAMTRTEQNALVFQAAGASLIYLELHTLDGRIAYRQRAAGPTLALAAPSRLANGLYFAHVTALAAEGTSTVRLFKLVLMR